MPHPLTRRDALRATLAALVAAVTAPNLARAATPPALPLVFDRCTFAPGGRILLYPDAGAPARNVVTACDFAGGRIR